MVHYLLDYRRMDTGRWLNTVAFVQYVRKKEKKKQEQARVESSRLLDSDIHYRGRVANLSRQKKNNNKIKFDRTAPSNSDSIKGE